MVTTRALQDLKIAISGGGQKSQKNGQKVAEVESGEDLLVFNPIQKKKYQHIIEALIADARGQKDFGISMRNHYNIPKTGPTIMKVIERVNTKFVESKTAKENAANESQEMYKEVIRIRERLDTEFEGYKKEREEETKSWETSKFYYTKKGNHIKKYPKSDLQS